MVAIVSDENYSQHLTPEGHPESPQRNSAVLEALVKENLNTIRIVPRKANDEEIALCHKHSYKNLVIAESEKNGEVPGPLSTGRLDTLVMKNSEKIARLAVGGVLAGVDYVMDGRNAAKSVFCVVRPPGHHACFDKGHGFCIYNNVAVGARYAQVKHKIKRVMIVDWDAHHGDGTQKIFQKDPNVFYFSTHSLKLFPYYTGYAQDNGKADGKGATLNIPISEVNSVSDVMEAYRNTLPKVMEQFRPQLVMISAGFDGHKLDPVGGKFLGLDEMNFGEMTRIVKGLAEIYAEGRVVSVLEGGYHLEALKASCVEHVKNLKSFKNKRGETPQPLVPVALKVESRQSKRLRSLKSQDSAGDEATIEYRPKV